MAAGAAIGVNEMDAGGLGDIAKADGPGAGGGGLGGGAEQEQSQANRSCKNQFQPLFMHNP
jgi:hypothetical protein